MPDRALATAIPQGRSAAPMLVATLCALLCGLVIGSRIDVSDKVFKPNPEGGEEVTMSEREIGEAMEKARTVEQVTRGLGAAAMPFEIFGLALLLYLVSRYVGGKPTLRRATVLAAYAALPGAVHALLAALAASQRQTLSPAEVAHLAMPLLGPIDPFALWSAVLIALGLPHVAGISRTKAVVTTAVCFGMWLVLTQLVLAQGPGGVS